MTTIELISSSTAELRGIVHYLMQRYPNAGYGTTEQWERIEHSGQWKVTVKIYSAD